jgi:L-threonylcarbamoyladenylate synthase
MDIVSTEKMGECVLRASGVLRKGGVIIYPTDTLYGLGADAFSDEAVAKVYAIKGRREDKPMHAVFSDMKMVEEYAELNDVARKLAERFLPGALTLVLQKKSGLDKGIVKGIETIGVRIPDNEFCLELAKTYGKPYTATSANRSGETPEISIEKIKTQLGESARLVDLAVDAAVFPMRPPTTVVNVMTGSPVILREGAISSKEILALF